MSILRLPTVFVLMTWMLLTSERCPQPGTRIQFRETINLLDHIQPAVTPSRGRRIQEIVFRGDLQAGTAVRSYRYGPTQFAMPAAGSESPPCNDGTPLLRAVSDPIIRILSLIGDTGDEDVSEDNDCSCDTHVDYIEFHPFDVVFADGEVLRIPPSRLNGKYVLCPSIRGGHHTSGDREFDGGATATFSLTVRVADDNLSLLADVRYDVVEN